MPRIYVEFEHLRQIGKSCQSVSAKVDSINADFQRTMRQLDWDVKYEADINNTGKQLARKLDIYKDTLKKYKNFVEDADRHYTKLDNEKMQISFGRESFGSKFIKELSSEYGWSQVLAGAGYIGDIYGFIQDIKNGKTWDDFRKTGMDIEKFIGGAVKTFSNYRKIGNAVGMKKAMTWWGKKITGLRPLGRASSAQHLGTRFLNNLTNKTSPFNAQIKGAIGNFKGANGVGAAAAAWGSVLVNGIMNWNSNKEEQANSNGTMSDARVVAETITETAIDTGLMIGAGAVAGAAVTAVLGTVAAPGVVVVAASGLLVAGINAGVKALTGKSFTEWASDTILDTGIAIGQKIGNAAKSVTNAIGSWFGRLAPA